ncbi:MFS transporter [Paenarthrobacter nitroguajacolicus]|uniref:MFS transporter n=1 Tax=Paenarthrobacter nitroguajacolicus TaxID=211146 RepID=UPI003ADF4C13
MTLAPLMAPHTSTNVRRARGAVSLLFFTNGAIFASMVPWYPVIKVDLGLSNAALGLAVAAFPLGALLAGLSAGLLVRRFRSSRVAVVATIFATVATLLAGIAPSWAVIAGGLFVAGAMDSLADVAQNSHGLRVQRLYGRSILNSFHAVWSIGAVAGGAAGAVAAGLGVSRTLHFVLIAVMCVVLAILSHRFLLRGSDPLPDDAATDAGVGMAKGSVRSRTWSLSRYGTLLLLVMIGSAGALMEDAGNSWSAIYLTEGFGASALVAGTGFIALQGMQVVGRLLSDRLVDRFGQHSVARSAGLIVLVGMGLALGFPSLVGSIIGFGLAGLGAAPLIPAAVHAADGLPGFRQGEALTIVSWLLRLGFLVSPPVVGWVADVSSLRLGLFLVPVAGLLVIIFSRVLGNKPR